MCFMRYAFRYESRQTDLENKIRHTDSNGRSLPCQELSLILALMIATLTKLLSKLCSVSTASLVQLTIRHISVCQTVCATFNRTAHTIQVILAHKNLWNTLLAKIPANHSATKNRTGSTPFCCEAFKASPSDLFIPVAKSTSNSTTTDVSYVATSAPSKACISFCSISISTSQPWP